MNVPGRLKQQPSPPGFKDQILWLFFRLDGRIGRWTFFLAVMLLAVLQGLALYRFAIAPQDSGQSSFWATSFWVIGILSMWSTFALGVKRLHDMGKPGVLALTLFIPVLLILSFVALCFWPGEPGPNAHGPHANSRGR